MAAPAVQPTPELIFNTFNAFQRTFALKGAVELDVFTHIADGATSAEEIARRSSSDARAMRILCDYLAINGFLTKHNGAYGLTPESAVFLNKKSPAYMGSIGKFLTTELHFDNYRDIAAVVRKGGTLHGQGSMEPENDLWVEFARSMVPIVMPAAQAIPPLVTKPDRSAKVLDIAAGHGMFGISIAKYNRAAHIVAVDWEKVLQVALSNAERAGVRDRYQTAPGSAFDVDFGSGFDIALLPNFLHHFDAPTNVKLLKRIHAAMKPGGILATLEFVPNDDRVTPPIAASFSMMMLASTEHGDAYTFREFDRMFREAGFGASRMQDLENSPERLILTERP